MTNLFSGARTLSLASLLAAFGMVAFAYHGPAKPEAGSDAPRHSLWGVDVLTSRGETYDLESQIGKVWVLSFFFTECSAFCPVQTAKLARVQRQLSPSVLSRSDFVSISIDPMGDTPASMDKYQKRYGVDPAQWRFAKTRSHEELDGLLDQLAIAVSRDERTGELDHRMLIFLVNSDGKVVQQYVGHSFDEKRLVNEISVLVGLENEEYES